MLVFLRPTAASTSAGSRALVGSAQGEVAAVASSFGSPVLARTSVPDTLTFSLTASEAAQLSADPLVAQVFRTRRSRSGQPRGGAARTAAGTKRAGAVPHPSCGTAREPQLNPEGLANIDDVHDADRGYTGKGIVVAFLADGLATNDPDLGAAPSTPRRARPRGAP